MDSDKSTDQTKEQSSKNVSIVGSEPIAVGSPVLMRNSDMLTNLNDDRKSSPTSSGSIILFLLSLGVLFAAYYLNNNQLGGSSNFNELEKSAEESRFAEQMANMLVTN